MIRGSTKEEVETEARLQLAAWAERWSRKQQTELDRQARIAKHNAWERKSETDGRLRSIALERTREAEAAIEGLTHIQIEVPAVKYKELHGNAEIESSATVPERALRARHVQLERFRPEKKVYANAQMPPRLIRQFCAISPEGEKLLETATQRLGLSARAHDRILKVSHTIADLDESVSIEPKHLSEAIQYRTLDRTYWA